MYLLQAKRTMRKLNFEIMDQKEMLVEVTYLAPYMEKVMKKLEEDKKHPAVHTYRSTLNSFMEFAGEGEDEKEVKDGIEKMPDAGKEKATKGKKVTEEVVIPVTLVFTTGKLKEYETWLRNRDASWNTVSTYMRVLKAVYNRLVEEKVLDYEAKLFNDVYTKVESQTKRSLTEEQMNTLLCADMEVLSEEMQRVFAYFLLMFLFRGMPFIDLAYLRKQDIKGNCITYCRHKTGCKMVVRIPKEAIELFEVYRNNETDSGYLFPILDDTLKKEKEVYACYQKALRDFNCKLGKLAALLLPGVGISSYTARHTWATLAFYSGIPIGIISKALGHSSIKVTETYLKPFENEKVDEANDELIIAIIKSNENKKVA